MLILSGLLLAASIYTFVKPSPYYAVVLFRTLMLPLIGFLCATAFLSMRSEDTIAQMFIVGVAAGWIFLARPTASLYPTQTGQVVILASEVDSKSAIIAIGAAAILLIIAALQFSSTVVGATGGRQDVGALVTFAICFACWAVITSALTLPWKVHSCWTVPALLIASVAFVVMLGLTSRQSSYSS